MGASTDEGDAGSETQGGDGESDVSPSRGGLSRQGSTASLAPVPTEADLCALGDSLTVARRRIATSKAAARLAAVLPTDESEAAYELRAEVAEAALSLSVALYSSDRVDEAVRCVREALTLAQGNYMGVDVLGRINAFLEAIYGLEDCERSVEWARKEVEADDNELTSGTYATFLLDYAQTLTELGDLEGARYNLGIALTRANDIGNLLEPQVALMNRLMARIDASIEGAVGSQGSQGKLGSLAALNESCSFDDAAARPAPADATSAAAR